MAGKTRSSSGWEKRGPVSSKVEILAGIDKRREIMIADDRGKDALSAEGSSAAGCLENGVHSACCQKLDPH